MYIINKKIKHFIGFETCPSTSKTDKKKKKIRPNLPGFLSLSLFDNCHHPGLPIASLHPV